MVRLGIMIASFTKSFGTHKPDVIHAQIKAATSANIRASEAARLLLNEVLDRNQALKGK